MGQRGRPSIGPRDRFVARPTEAVGKRIREDAAKLGITHSELICRVMASYYGTTHLKASGATIYQLEPLPDLPMTG